MRVIAGTSRGRRLAELKGFNVRPTPDRVREALFSILQSRLGTFQDLAVLDLFAGSGALAIEALSRGARSACLVEADRATAKMIQENLERCRMLDRAEIVKSDAAVALQRFPEAAFDLIFLDPPYHKGLAEQALNQIAASQLLTDDGILCAETGADEVLPDAVGMLVRFDQRRYGTIMIHFYSISDEELQ